MTEFRMPKRDRSPGLIPYPRTDEPEYPTLTTRVVENVALHQQLDAAIARADRAEEQLSAAVAGIRRAKEQRDRAKAALIERVCRDCDSNDGDGDPDCSDCLVDAALSDKPPEVKP